MFERAMWFKGDTSLIGFYWDYLLNDLVIVDGHADQIGSQCAWMSFLDHSKVKVSLAEYRFGDGASFATHMLILDRARRKFSVAEYHHGESMLKERAACTPSVKKTPYKPTALRLASVHGRSILDHSLVDGHLAAEIEHMSKGPEKAMLLWLDQC